MKRDVYMATVFDGTKVEKLIASSPATIEQNVMDYLREHNLQDNAVQIYKNGKPFDMIAYDPEG